MARRGKREPRPPQPLPEPLPPERRTIGQLVAETISFYRRHFWQSLPLGLSFVVVDQLTLVFATRHDQPYGHPPPRSFQEAHSFIGGGVAMFIVLGALLLTASYVVAVVLVTGVKPTPSQLATAYAAGIVVYLPVPLLQHLLVLPAVLYLAFMGWVVPAILVEGASFRGAFGRSIRLARTDYVHAAGGLATLVILFEVVRLLMVLLIHIGAETERRGTFGAADLVLSPLIFLGSAIVYIDLAAREKPSQ